MFARILDPLLKGVDIASINEFGWIIFSNSWLNIYHGSTFPNITNMSETQTLL